MSIAAVWRRSSFSVKFAAVLLITGLVISIVPLWLSQNATNSQALDRAADKAGVAANLIQTQHSALTTFTSGVAHQIAALPQPATGAALQDPLKQDASVNESGDVVGVILPDSSVVAYTANGQLPQDDALLQQLTGGVAAGRSIVGDDSGHPWLIAFSNVENTGALTFTGRQLTPQFITAIDRNIETNADPADLVVVRDGRVAAGETFVGTAAGSGSGAAPAVQQTIRSGAPQLATLNQTSVALAAQPLGDGFSVAVATPVSAVSATVTPVLVLVALILLAILIIVAVVQSELQRPLRRLDRAVAALGRGDFDAPLPLGRDDELGRLAESFDAMRTQLHATIRAAASRAAVATELSSSQPLETSLSRAVRELRTAVQADSALILVSRSEMSDSFAILEGVGPVDVDTCLSGDGPLGIGYRQDGTGALLASAAPSSREAQLGMRELCVAPLRIGTHVHGVLAVANHSAAFLPSDVELVGSLADQVALALERYSFLAMVQRQASTDDLTGLYNHRFLVDYLGQQVALAERLNAPLAVLMLDIDFFKKLNDTHGHQAGDTALAVFAQTLLHSVRTSDLAARYGGEEFAVVMYNTGSSEARLVAEKIRKAVSQTIIELSDHSRLAVTVSIGGAAFPEDTSSARELLALADEALYRAKGGGRDRTCMVSDYNHRGRAA